jgi:uncharacterized protein YrrD
MRKAKELIGKTIVHQATGNRLATVRDLVFDADARTIVALLVDQGGWFSDPHVVRWTAVVSAGDIIVVQGDTPIVPVSTAADVEKLLAPNMSLTDKAIISTEGQHIGTVGDLFINDAGEVVGYDVSRGLVSDLRGRLFLLASNVQAVGKDAVIATPTEQATDTNAIDQQPKDRLSQGRGRAKIYPGS